MRSLVRPTRHTERGVRREERVVLSRLEQQRLQILPFNGLLLRKRTQPNSINYSVCKDIQPEDTERAATGDKARRDGRTQTQSLYSRHDSPHNRSYSSALALTLSAVEFCDEGAGGAAAGIVEEEGEDDEGAEAASAATGSR